MAKLARFIDEWESRPALNVPSRNFRWAYDEKPLRCISAGALGYSIFTSALYKNLNAKWPFPQEKATFQALVTSTYKVKML
jgi:hypothetical protein